MNQFEERDRASYLQKNFNYSNINTYVPEVNQNFYKSDNQSDFIQSKIVSESNTSSIMIGHGHTNTVDSIQVESQYLTQKYKALQPQSNLYSKRTHENHAVITRNKINVISQNQSALSHKNSQSSLNKRSGSTSRGGIRVVSRNSSLQKKSQTSLEKPIKQQNTASNMPFCGLNCTTRSPFLQNQSQNEAVIIPNLGSIQTLKSQNTYQQCFSERDKAKPKNQFGTKGGHNFYDNVTDITHIEPSPKLGKNHSNKSQKQNLDQNIQKIYKNVREMMQSQILLARKLYEKKYEDEVDSLNTFYHSQIQTLQIVLGENQTFIEAQAKRIQRLEDKNDKKQAKLQKYQQKFQSIYKFIESSGKFAAGRLNEVEHKFSLLVQEYQNIGLNQSSVFKNKIQYLQHIFLDMMAQTIQKYRSIEFEIKDQVKQMMKRYDYFEEKVYEMDLIKHLGKENQIQNYRLIQKIQNIKEQLVLAQSKQNNKFSLSPRNIKAENQTLDPSQVNELRQTIFKLRSQILLSENEKSQMIRQMQLLQNNINQERQRNDKTQNEGLAKQTFKIAESARQIERLNDVIDQYQSKIQQLHVSVQNLQAQNTRLSCQINKMSKNQAKMKGFDQLNIQKLNQNLKQKQLRLDQVTNELQSEIKEKQELSEALQMTEQIFDEQITKFKQTIKTLQEENQLLLSQLDQARQQKQKLLTDSVSSKNSENYPQKILKLSKSPKKQVCETITMGWFKKSVQNTKINGQDLHKRQKDFYNLPTQKNVTPDRIKEQFSRDNSSSPENQQFFYPSNTTRQSFECTSIMQSHPNIIQKNQKYNSQTRSQNVKVKLRHSSSTPVYNTESHSSMGTKIKRLRNCLQRGSYPLPVQCTLDSQGQLQLFQTGIYIVDDNYRPFEMSETELSWAQKQGILTLIALGQQEENYIH